MTYYYIVISSDILVSIHNKNYTYLLYRIPQISNGNEYIFALICLVLCLTHVFVYKYYNKLRAVQNNVYVYSFNNAKVMQCVCVQLSQIVRVVRGKELHRNACVCVNL